MKNLAKIAIGYAFMAVMCAFVGGICWAIVKHPIITLGGGAIAVVTSWAWTIGNDLY